MKIAMLTIIKNEMKFIARYLEKNKNADYICLLDTGSTDGTWEYLESQAQTNPKLIIQQKVYKPFRFDTARNDSMKLVPDDTNIIVMLDVDEYFLEDNWTDIVRDEIEIDNERHMYVTYYRDASTYSLTDYARFFEFPRMIQTKRYNWQYCVHEILCDDDTGSLGISETENVWWNNLLIIHDPDLTKPRDSYLDLCKQRCVEDIPVERDVERENLYSQELLFFEYFRNDMYEEALNIYTTYNFQDYDFIQFDTATNMYLMTNDLSYLETGISLLPTHWYDAQLLYYALTYDFEFCRQYKTGIENQIRLHSRRVPEKYKEYDELGNIVEELAKNL